MCERRSGERPVSALFGSVRRVSVGRLSCQGLRGSFLAGAGHGWIICGHISARAQKASACGGYYSGMASHRIAIAPGCNEPMYTGHMRIESITYVSQANHSGSHLRHG